MALRRQESGVAKFLTHLAYTLQFLSRNCFGAEKMFEGHQEHSSISNEHQKSSLPLLQVYGLLQIRLQYFCNSHASDRKKSQLHSLRLLQMLLQLPSHQARPSRPSRRRELTAR